MVDVSGKGIEAGTRALLLSGALGGLLGAVPEERFLAEANRYLLRQSWSEGFATGVHLALDLDTGAYRLASAGHPPAVHYTSGSGRWHVSSAEGDLLGLLPEVTGRIENGVLAHGDAMMLYTDGLIEVAGRDLGVGIDKLIGAAEGRLIGGGFAGGAAELISAMDAGAEDDRALVLVWRA